MHDYDRTAARGVIVKDKLSVELKVGQAKYEGRPIDEMDLLRADWLPYQASILVMMKSGGTGKKLEWALAETHFEARYNQADREFDNALRSFEVSNKAKLGVLGEYVEDLLIESFGEWRFALPSPILR